MAMYHPLGQMQTLRSTVAWPPLTAHHYGNKLISTFKGVISRRDRLPAGSIMACVVRSAVQKIMLWKTRYIQPKCSFLTFRSLYLFIHLFIFNFPHKLLNHIQRRLCKRNRLIPPVQAVRLFCLPGPITSQLMPSSATLCELWPCTLPL